MCSDIAPEHRINVLHFSLQGDCTNAQVDSFQRSATILEGKIE
jgi:hypothetical protein